MRRHTTWMAWGIAAVAGLMMCGGSARSQVPSGGMEDDAASEESVPAAPATQAPATQAPAGQAGSQAPAADTGTGGSGAGGNAVGYPAASGQGTAPQTPNAAGASTANPGFDPNANGASTPAANNEAQGPAPEMNADRAGNTAANAGTGGTGNSGTAPSNTAPSSTAPSNTAQAPTSSGSTSPSAPGGGIAVVDAIYTGTVSSVSSGEVVIDNAGTPLSLEIGSGTRVFRDGQAIRANQLKEGEPVRAVVNIVGKSHTREIAVLSGTAARRASGRR